MVGLGPVLVQLQKEKANTLQFSLNFHQRRWSKQGVPIATIFASCRCQTFSRAWEPEAPPPSSGEIGQADIEQGPANARCAIWFETKFGWLGLNFLTLKH